MYYSKAEIQEKNQETFTAVASTDAEDRQGERVRVEGWNLKNFKDNPILLFMHDHTKPIGKATKVWIEKASGKPKLMFKGVISDATEVGRAARQLMEEGILNSFSVGFRPLEMDGNMITKSELYEISLVSVPANPEARLVLAKSLEGAGFGNDVIKEFAPEDKDEIIESLKIELKETKEIAEKAQSQAELAVKGLEYLASQNGSKQEVVTERLHQSKVIAKAADKLLGKQNVSSAKRASYVKVIKISSEQLIRGLKGEL